jgi:hypothetical protein
MFAMLEAAGGALCFAITIARLVASRQALEGRQDS